jgi:flagellar biogenesis protein FliO
MKTESRLNKNMLNKNSLNPNLLNLAGLRKVAFHDVANPTAPAAIISIDLWRRLRAWWKRLRRWSQRAPRRLRLCDSLPLGERRFVAVVEFEHSRFLVGGTPSSLVLLARLGNDQAQNREDEKEKDHAQQNDTADKNEIAPPTPSASAIFTRFEP